MSGKHPFLAASSWEPLSAHTWGGHPDSSWYQGRGAFGGILAAGWMRVFSSLVADAGRIPRSLTVHFCAPAVAMPTTLDARVERKGGLVTHLAGTMRQDGATVTLASATFATPRTVGPTYQDDALPEVLPFSAENPPWADASMPTFTQHFEYRFCGGLVPFGGGERAHMAAWLRPRVPMLLDAPLACALLDAMPPAVFTRLHKPAPAASVDFTIHLFHALPLPGATPEDPYLCTVESHSAGHGYTQQLNRLWRADGTLLGQCSQLIAVLG